MYGQKKDPWDVVPEMKKRSFEHLAAVAQAAVKELLGPSPQEAQQAADEEDYQRQLRYWEDAQSKMGEEEFEERFGSLPPKPERKTRYKTDLDEWLKDKLQARILSRIDSLLLDMIGVEQPSWGGPLKMKSGSSPLGQRLAEKAKEMATKLADRWVEENKDFVIFTEKNPERDKLIKQIRDAEAAVERAADELMLIRNEKSDAYDQLNQYIVRMSEEARQAKAQLASMDARYNKEGVRIEDVFRHFRFELEKSTKSALEDRIKKIAVERAQLVKQEVLEAAVDQAMFDTYPILRRAEAARRLDAKTEEGAT